MPLSDFSSLTACHLWIQFFSEIKETGDLLSSRRLSEILESPYIKCNYRFRIQLIQENVPRICCSISDRLSFTICTQQFLSKRQVCCPFFNPAFPRAEILLSWWFPFCFHVVRAYFALQLLLETFCHTVNAEQNARNSKLHYKGKQQQFTWLSLWWNTELNPINECEELDSNAFIICNVR
jgi:hypothetical protein